MLMNHIGTHDTERAVTVLAGEPSQGRGREWQSAQTLSSGQRERGVRLMMAASAMQYTLPGVPCVYYGDEAAWRVIRIPSTGAVTPGAGKIRSCLPGTGGWGKSERSIPFQRGKLPPAESQRQPAGLRPGGPGRKKPVGSLRLLLRKNPETLDLPLEFQNGTVLLGGSLKDRILTLQGESCCLIRAARDLSAFAAGEERDMKIYVPKAQNQG